MKRCLYWVPVLAIVVTVSLGVSPLWQLCTAGDGLATNDKDSVKLIDWKKDAVCRMVFFAVLEGLYSDGVPDDVVDSLVPKTADGNPLKQNFVVECPLCHPVYEALVQYQGRAAFRDTDQKKSTFGNGLTKDECNALKSESRMQRLQALRPLVRRWVERRMAMMRLSESEQAELTAALAKRSQQGRDKLLTLMKQDPAYNTGWSMYWGCAACNGATDACKDFPDTHSHKK